MPLSLKGKKMHNTRPKAQTTNDKGKIKPKSCYMNYHH